MNIFSDVLSARNFHCRLHHTLDVRNLARMVSVTEKLQMLDQGQGIGALVVRDR